jgi:biotin carboxylase
MQSTTARTFRDKLSMRLRAHDAGILVPEFVHVLNYDEIGDYMKRVPPPWVLKPRSDVSAVGIKKLFDPEQVWRAIDELDARERLRERSSYYLLERFVPGDVFHVDSLVAGGKVVFAGVNAYGRPPMDVAHQGGVFISYTLRHNSAEQKELLKLNRKLITKLGLTHGAAHAEFIRSREDGRFYFLEIAARVGGAYIAEVLEAASGLNLWREWAKIEIAHGERPYEAEPTRKEYGGIVLSLARQEFPDTSAYNESEIVYRVKKRHHVGLVVRSQSLERVRELLDEYARRFAEDFLAIVPPLERAE